MIFILLLLSFFLEYFRPDTYFPVIATFKLNVIIPIATFIASLCSTKEGNSNNSILFSVNSQLLLFFVGLLVLSTFTSVVTFYAYTKLKTVYGYFLLYFVVSKEIDSRKKLNLFIMNLMFIHLLLVFLNPKVILNPETRSYIQNVTFLGDGNDFALSLCILLPWCLYFFNEGENNAKKMFALGVGGLTVFAIIGTQSRGASIGLASIMVYQWVKSRRKLMGLVMLGGVVLGVLVFASHNYLERMESIADYETEGSAQGRIMAWKSAFRMALDSPLLGQGAGHFGVKYGTEFRPPGIGRTEIPWSTAHSVYFLALGELGFPGLLFIICLLWYNFHKNNQLIRNAAELPVNDAKRLRFVAITLNSTVIGFAVPGVFLSALYYPHLFVISGLCDAVRRLSLKETIPPRI